MDEHAHAARPTTSSSPPSPATFIFAAGNGNLVFEFPCSEVPEQWLMIDNDDDDNVQEQQPRVDGGSLSSGPADLSENNPAAAARQGHLSHVEAERNRRDKLHRLFCDLRAAVPAVSRMDKASLLADADAYIVQLRARVEQLELEATRAAVRKANPFADDATASASEEELEVRMVVGQPEAALRLTTAARHAPARFMDALRSLDLLVQHACVARVDGVTVQDAVVDMPAELWDEGCLHAALLRRLQQSG